MATNPVKHVAHGTRSITNTKRGTFEFIRTYTGTPTLANVAETAPTLGVTDYDNENAGESILACDFSIDTTAAGVNASTIDNMIVDVYYMADGDCGLNPFLGDRFKLVFTAGATNTSRLDCSGSTGTGTEMFHITHRGMSIYPVVHSVTGAVADNGKTISVVCSFYAAAV